MDEVDATPLDYEGKEAGDGGGVDHGFSPDKGRKGRRKKGASKSDGGQGGELFIARLRRQQAEQDRQILANRVHLLEIEVKKVYRYIKPRR